MDQAAIFLPTCALAAWTFAVLLLIPFARFTAARSRFPTVFRLARGAQRGAAAALETNRSHIWHYTVAL
jgi:hypothetical protein